MQEDDVKKPLLSSNSSLNRRIDESFRSTSCESFHKKNRQQQATRRPFHYPIISQQGHISYDSTNADVATYNRYRYYSKLADPSLDALTIPDHVVPANFFIPFSSLINAKGKQSSIITIFAIWNTMMGTSLLSIPWAIQQAGFACALIIILVMGLICFYTALRIVRLPKDGNLPPSAIEFPDICRHLLGRWAEWTSIIFSLITLVGGAVVYWVLMSNFLYNTVLYIYETATTVHNSTNPNLTEVYCPLPYSMDTNATSELLLHPSKDTFHKMWDLDGTVPIYMAVILGPLICLKSPTFFTKLNAVGTLSVFYLMAFVITKAIQWGIHFEPTHHKDDTDYVSLFQKTFPALSGILSLAFFIHSCVLSIMRNQKNPENNSRDLGIAYMLVACTYLIVGVGFFISFPLSKTCIQDNLLNNFVSSDLFSVITRVFLLFQVFTLFPLVIYIVRVQFMHFAFGSIYPGFKHILILNIVILIACVLFAVFMPRVGTIIRFVGAFAGLAYIFTLPSLAYMKVLKDKGALSSLTVIFHVIIIILGICNFISQFIIAHE